MGIELGSWITNHTAVPFYARKKFCVDKEVEKASAKVCGLGQFVFYMNGKKVGDHELDPGWTDYRKYIQYVEFDVTEYIVEGENVLGAEVGNGWYHKMDEHYTFAFPKFMPPNPNPYQPYGKELVLALELNIAYSDGTSMVIQADDTFEVKKHPVVMSNVYGSETIDFRLRQKGWCEAGFDASGWEKAAVLSKEEQPKAELSRQFQPAVKVIHTYDGRLLGEVVKADGDAKPQKRYIYDFGQNMSGILELEARGKAGDRILLYPAEKLGPDGDVDQMAKGWVNLDSCITFVIGEDDTWETFRMKFTYFAGRYAAVEKILSGDCGGQIKGQMTPAENIGKVQASSVNSIGEVQTSSVNSIGKEQTFSAGSIGKGQTSSTDSIGKEQTASAGSVENKRTEDSISIRNVKAHAISSAWKTDGAFACDDVRYEQIYQMIERTVEANMLSVHTDCPTIERFAWQEPNHLMAPSIFYMKDGSRLWEKFLLDMRMGQHTAEDYFFDFEGRRVYPGDGLMPSQCPCYIPNVLPVPGMGSFYDIIPWGSTCILGTWWHYQFYGDERIVRDNYEAGMRYFKHLKTKVNADGFLNHGLGDWGNPNNELARENIETAFLYADAVTLARFAAILGRDADRAGLEEYARGIKENYNEKLLIQHPQEGFWCYRAWDHPDEVLLTQACEALPLFWGLAPEDKIEDIKKAFVYILKKSGALISGEVGLPYVIQTARSLGMNDVIAEYILKEEHPSYYAFVLDGETTLGEYWETNPRSHCHDMMGHIIEWYYNGIAGIQPLEPGFKKVLVRPYLPQGMHEFTCSYQSVRGEIRVHVKEMETEILLEAAAPEAAALEIETERLAGKGKKVVVQISQAMHLRI